MKHTNFLLCLSVFFWTHVLVSVRAQAQDGAPPTSTEETQWLQLAKKITELENIDPYETAFDQDEETAQLKGHAVATLEQLTNQVRALPKAQLVQAYRYMLEHALVEHFRYTSASNVISTDPSSENVRFVKSYFDKFPTQKKSEFLVYVVLNAIMLHPEVPEFRDFPREILQKAVQGLPVSQDLVSQAALALVTHTTPAEKTLMHKALSKDSKNSGLWNALTQLDLLTPAEVQKARAMFPTLKDNLGWRLTLALALSPYDSQMNALVQRSVESELQNSNDTDIAAILSNPNLEERQRQLKESASIRVLAALNHWELEKALPYLFRVLRSQNPFVANMAMPILAVRAPQEVLRIARLPHARDEFMHLDLGVGLVALIYPQYQLQVRQILDSGIPQDDEFRGYEQVTRHLLNRGVLSAF